MTRKRLSLLAATAASVATLGFASSALAAGTLDMIGPLGAAGTLVRDGCTSTTLEATRIRSTAPGATFALQVNDVAVATGQVSGTTLSIAAQGITLPAGASLTVRETLPGGAYGISVLRGVVTPDIAGAC